MSRLVSALILWLAASALSPAFAQEAAPAQTMARVQALLEASAPGKQIFVARQLQLTPEEAAGFWPIYDAWQGTLANLSERRDRLLSAMAGGSGKPADLAEELTDLDIEEAEQRQRMFERLARAIPTDKAVRYLELELSLAALNHFRRRAADAYRGG
ncbi:hypothetical protein [Arenimonas fontis]|uniref:LTXXQ motif family protein n=1 Tax=Arenimonas fontis TaxID=2608255 RepID=A0A5B2Z956_9GAMM|nr:hypothetical protein [Arenimonas fontis]KAA2283692.1 hypothetical protein F0415_12090 [Arenimonas fontis]